MRFYTLLCFDNYIFVAYDICIYQISERILQPLLGRCDEQLPFNLLYNLGLYVSAVTKTDNPVVRVILARNCIIGDNNVGCMRV